MPFSDALNSFVHYGGRGCQRWRASAGMDEFGGAPLSSALKPGDAYLPSGSFVARYCMLPVRPRRVVLSASTSILIRNSPMPGVMRPFRRKSVRNVASSRPSAPKAPDWRVCGASGMRVGESHNEEIEIQRSSGVGASRVSPWDVVRAWLGAWGLSSCRLSFLV